MTCLSGNKKILNRLHENKNKYLKENDEHFCSQLIILGIDFLNNNKIYEYAKFAIKTSWK